MSPAKTPDFRFERTYDMELVRQIATEPSVFRMIADDYMEPAEFHPVADPAVLYLLAFEGETLLGVWVFVPENTICWQVHTWMLPVARGRALRAAKLAMEWIWHTTPCLRITTTVPAFNRLALSLAQKTGMMETGVNPRSFMKHGKLWSQTLLGVSRPGVI
jgi:RimJ/RimL family protein N-acetyltransferase